MSQNQNLHPTVYKRLARELNSLQREVEPGWHVELYYPNDLSKWRLYLNGPRGTPYEDGEFQLSITFSPEYPFSPPNVYFDTKIFHPNVDVNGAISINRFTYNPASKLRCLLQDILFIIRNPTSKYFLNNEAGFLFERRLESFHKEAVDWTKRYATGDEIMSDRSSSPPPSGNISPETNSPNSLRAHSPTSTLRVSQAFFYSIGVSPEDWYPYPTNEQLIIGRAFRSDLSYIELKDKLINFAYATQLDEDNNCRPVKMNTPPTNRLCRRQKCLAFYSAKSFVEDSIITYCLAPSVSTRISAITAGIRHEGMLNGKKSEAEDLAQQLEVLDENDTTLIGLRCLYLYTLASFLSRALNKFLRTRDYSKIDTLGPFCKILLSQFNKYASDIESLKVYRGENLREPDLHAYKRATGKGSYQWLGFTSASRDRKAAELFIRNTFFIIRLEKLYNDGRALHINKLSQFYEEDEVIFRPGVEFSIDRFEYDQNSKKYTFYLIAYI